MAYVEFQKSNNCGAINDYRGSLHDVYKLFDKDKAAEQTAYIMQFLWRDLTSSYDIVGPYYTNSEMLDYSCLCV